MKVLVACEESQAVCKAFREKGHEAYSCDIIDCSGGHPEWHIKCDVLKIINGNRMFSTCDGNYHLIKGNWDLIIAHPPCTYLTVTGNRWFNVERYGEKAIERQKLRNEAIKFFMELANANCERIAIENPVGGMRKMQFMQGLPRYTVTYCQYGERRQKPTDIWTNHPDPQFKPPCKRGSPCHEAAPRGSQTGTQGLRNAKEKGVIPEMLCNHIVDICEKYIKRGF